MRKRRGQSGFVLSLELIFLATMVIAVAVIGWGALSAKVVAEMGDVGQAVGSLNQSYSISGMAVQHRGDPIHPTPYASVPGSQNIDYADFCDNDPNCACGIQICIPPTPERPHPAIPTP